MKKTVVLISKEEIGVFQRDSFRMLYYFTSIWQLTNGKEDQVSACVRCFQLEGRNQLE
jgi:hypothetical protein